MASLRDRIYALGLVHHQLMGSADLRTFDVAPFLRELASNIQDGGASSRRRASTSSADPLDVGLDFAIPLGLLVTELVTNSLKHAVPGGEGHVDVSLSRNDDGTFGLVVSDNGVGYACHWSSRRLGRRVLEASSSKALVAEPAQGDDGRPTGRGTRAEIHIKAAA